MNTEPSLPRLDPLEGRGLNIFRTLAHNPALSEAFQVLGGHLLRDGLVDARQREIVILRVGWRCGSEYEFGQHSRIGQAVGLTSEEVARLAGVGTGSWDPAEQLLIDLADELCSGDMVSDKTWAGLAERYGSPELLELLVLAGYYRLVSGMLNSVGVPLESQTVGWPEGAQAIRRAPRDRPPPE